jgi:Ca2+-binding RTX toxin-like protein
MQSLEARQVLSAMSLLDGGVLTIQADDEPNQIVAWANKETDTLVIKVDETEFEFTDSLVRRIEIFGNGGGDTIGIRDSVTQSTRLDGGLGPDTIVGSQQADVIVGGPGNDRLSGRGGNDRIDGGLGSDAIAGGEGSDAIQGGVGSDHIDGGAGDDRILGDAESDAEGGEPIESDGGNDGELSLAEALQRSADAGGGVSVDGPIGPPDIEPVPVDPTYDDVIRGGAGAVWIFGDATNNYPEGYTDPVQYAIDFANRNRGGDVISGDAGNDVILGGHGNDRVRGGADDDMLVGGEGSDRLSGGDGDDDDVIIIS